MPTTEGAHVKKPNPFLKKAAMPEKETKGMMKKEMKMSAPAKGKKK